MSQASLFESNDKEAATGTRLQIVDGIIFIKKFLRDERSDALFKELSEMPGWHQDDVVIYGKKHKIPRLHRWFSDSNLPYRWSGISMKPEPFTESLVEIVGHLEKKFGEVFNTALGNLYRNGRDSVSWHSDDEPDLGLDPTIASISLGATRTFLLREKSNPKNQKKIELTHGSLVLMSGAVQRIWQHSIPKEPCQDPRINITFRSIK